MKNNQNPLRRPTSQREQVRRTFKRLAIGLAILSAASLLVSFLLDQPLFAFASFVFLIAAVLAASPA